MNIQYIPCWQDGRISIIFCVGGKHSFRQIYKTTWLFWDCPASRHFFGKTVIQKVWLLRYLWIWKYVYAACMGQIRVFKHALDPKVARMICFSWKQHSEKNMIKTWNWNQLLFGLLFLAWLESENGNTSQENLVKCWVAWQNCLTQF